MSVTSTEFFRYLTVSEVDRQWGLYVTGAGRLTVASGQPYPIKRHPVEYQFSWPQRRILPEYQLFYLTSGAGQFASRHLPVRTVATGSIVLTFPGEWHSYRPCPDTGWSQWWFGFNGEIAERLECNGFLSRNRPVLPVGISDVILQAFGRLLDRVQSLSPGCQQTLAGNVMEILSVANNTSHMNAKTDLHKKRVEQIKGMMEMETGKKKSIEDLSQSIGMSQAQLRRIFKRHTGMSPYQHQLQTRINRAKELLQATSLTVKEIARILNFETPFHFSATFKKKTGLAPLHWRYGKQSETEVVNNDPYEN